MALIRDDFPAPFGPMIAWIWRAGTERSICAKATAPPKLSDSPSTARMPGSDPPGRRRTDDERSAGRERDGTRRHRGGTAWRRNPIIEEETVERLRSQTYREIRERIQKRLDGWIPRLPGKTPNLLTYTWRLCPPSKAIKSIVRSREEDGCRPKLGADKILSAAGFDRLARASRISRWLQDGSGVQHTTVDALPPALPIEKRAGAMVNSAPFRARPFGASPPSRPMRCRVTRGSPRTSSACTAGFRARSGVTIPDTEFGSARRRAATGRFPLR